MLGDGFEEGIYDAGDRLPTAFGDDLFYSPPAEQLALAIAGIENTVTEEDEHVPRFHLEFELVVLGFIKESQRQASRLDDFVPAVVHEDRAGKPGVSDSQGPVFVIPNGIDDRNKLC